MILYNLFPRLAGKFPDWVGHLERAAELGFDWVFVNPIQQTGQSKSLYSITDYFTLNPDFVDTATATPPNQQIREVVRIANGLGLRMMTDLVVSHCAYDSDLVHQHPRWFVRHDGAIAHPAYHGADGRGAVWHDLAQFDHRHSTDRDGLFAYVLRVVEHLIGLGFEGLRCDAAYQLPSRVWQRLISEVKARHPNVLFVAETLGCGPDETRETAHAGFDFIHNSSKWWNFYDHWLLEQYNLTREEAPSIGFPESHDTPRLCEEAEGNLAALEQRYLFSALYSAGVMMPMGFEFGFRKPLHVSHTTPADWEQTDIDLRDFIRKTNQVKRMWSVFHEECPIHLLPYGNPQVLLLWKGSRHDNTEALVILNKDTHQRQEFFADSLRTMVQTGAALKCVSPKNPLAHVSEPFHYDLRPGEAIVLVARS